MKILFDSRQEQYKTPFGTVRRGENCILHMDIPEISGTVGVGLVLEDCDGVELREIPFVSLGKKGQYTRWQVRFTQPVGLYFYWFRCYKKEGSFRLFRQGRETNMEAGEKWQVSFIPEDFTVPDYARGAVMYQILPDRFFHKGECDLTGKLQPYTVHENWEDMPNYGPDAEGNWNGDFFGGNLNGIREKLPYLHSLGVGIIYLNPIFMAYSNHRYDTADYKRIDPMLGTEADFKALCDAAHEMGIRIVLDGVFSHTGSNSVYFDSEGIFGGGAVSDPHSPYRKWYRFQHYPDTYEGWWGIKTLPCVEELEKSYIDYIIEDKDSVAAHWMALGADGFRLDVVDELPDAFVKRLKERIRSINPQALLIGEVWEDASNKAAYGVSRRYFVDAELDSTMNYPWRKAIMAFVMEQEDGAELAEAIMSLAENYPPQVLSCVMNLLGTHDTPRILTALVDSLNGSKEEKAKRRLTPEQRQEAMKRLRMAAFLQFTLPGMASIYYGDEAGMEGHDDPFCRRTYPWGKEDKELQSYFAALCKLKNTIPALKYGDIRVTEGENGRISYRRCYQGEEAEIYVNRSNLPWRLDAEGTLRMGQNLNYDGQHVTLSPGGYCILLRNIT